MTNRPSTIRAWMLALCLAALPSYAAVTHQFTSTGSGTTTQTLSGFSVTAGDLLVCWTGIVVGGMGGTPITDSKGDTFVANTVFNGFNSWIVVSAVGGATNFTTNYATTNSFIGFECIDTGIPGSTYTYDTGTGGTFASGGTPPITYTTSSFSTAVANDVIIAISNINQVGGMNATSPATLLTKDTITGLSSEYWLTSSSGSNTMSFTYSTGGASPGGTMVAVAIKPPGGGGASGGMVVGGKAVVGGKVVLQ